jgi:hypothetical protein
MCSERDDFKEYKDILEIRPKCNTESEESDECCNICICIPFSPIVLLFWTGLCCNITIKKYCCTNTNSQPEPIE